MMELKMETDQSRQSSFYGAIRMEIENNVLTLPGRWMLMMLMMISLMHNQRCQPGWQLHFWRVQSLDLLWSRNILHCLCQISRTPCDEPLVYILLLAILLLWCRESVMTLGDSYAIHMNHIADLNHQVFYEETLMVYLQPSRPLWLMIGWLQTMWRSSL